ncbi:peptidyl-prolyl cis-trans isomerase-like 4 [Corticium candelabrum]|uniref:peptidyl-prolyl cis-trans isomerase-like 4 n=1 Tax=Corticium candelabrum TaxID=121492 RepID=UPI002E26E2FB|nr:peptidyl-prolyl cis-trans isomerase-like 4 [Corticium candelabrum]
MAVLVETSAGDVVIDLYTEERPRTCLNFVKLCKVKYYNYCIFHNVQRNFILQTGDPTKTGSGGESVFRRLYGDQAQYFEMEKQPRLKHDTMGTVSMVNNGRDMCGSQFFITASDNIDYLDDQHCVFGHVVEGIDVIEKINASYCDDNGRPYKDIRINHTIVLDDPFDDPKGLEMPSRSPSPTAEQLASDRIGADEEIDDKKGLTMEQVEEKVEAQEAQASAQILEMVGDLPDADIKPPDDVLFVCKLNPVTTDDDLEIIFSRFGAIKSCEVIRDQKSGESLQYAFIEYEKEEDCEEAYFKMDNVLIDDRRIHVDFSQSVSKLRQQQSLPGRGDTKKADLAVKEKFDKTKGSSYGLVFDDSSKESDRPRKSKRKSRSPERQSSGRRHHDRRHNESHRGDRRRSDSSRHDRRHRDESSADLRRRSPKRRSRSRSRSRERRRERSRDRRR